MNIKVFKIGIFSLGVRFQLSHGVRKLVFVMERNTGLFTTIGIVVAVLVAAIGGYSRGGYSEAIAFGTGIGAFGALVFVAYFLVLRIVNNHIQHLLIKAVLAFRKPGISALNVDEVQQEYESTKKDFKTIDSVIQKNP